MGQARDTLAALESRFPDAEVQTHKIEAKMVVCRGCQRPLLVNRFYAPARASCSECGLGRSQTAVDAGVGQTVPAGLVEEARERYPDCRCGVGAGTPLASLQALGAGCTAGSGRTPGWVCPALSMIRRRVL